MPSLIVLLIILLGIQIVQSERGYFGLDGLRQQRAQLQGQLSELQHVNNQLQIRIHRLSDGSLDGDFLDERARMVLGLAAQDEVVIFDHAETILK